VAAVVDAALVGADVVGAIADGGRLAVLRDLGESGAAVAGLRPDVQLCQVFVPKYRTARAVLDELRILAEKGALTLRVADVLPASEAAPAHRRLEAGGVRGRLVLVF
jgi:NADPH:quinone reductase-like Zn-dependent oxidoreductase